MLNLDSKPFPESFTLLIIVCSLVMFTLIIVITILFAVFQKRKIKFITERNDAELRYQEEVARTQLEIQEITLKNISWELHDNIGQLLSVANLELNRLQKEETIKNGSRIFEIQGLVAKSLQEIRSLSRSLNKEVVNQLGLVKSTENELVRLRKLGLLETKLVITGEEWSLPHDDTIILFRIIQEFMTNVIKHAKAAKLKLLFSFSSNNLKIQASDDGIGFNVEKVYLSSGLLNMKSRAALINSYYKLTSEKGRGTTLEIRYLRK